MGIQCQGATRAGGSWGFRDLLGQSLSPESIPPPPRSGTGEGQQGNHSPRHWAPPGVPKLLRLGWDMSPQVGPAPWGPGQVRAVGSWRPPVLWHHWGEVLGCRWEGGAPGRVRDSQGWA